MSPQQKRAESRGEAADAKADHLKLELLELHALRPLLDAAYHLLGADHSHMGNDEAEVAHQLVRVVLGRIDELFELVREEARARVARSGEGDGRSPRLAHK